MSPLHCSCAFEESLPKQAVSEIVIHFSFPFAAMHARSLSTTRHSPRTPIPPPHADHAHPPHGIYATPLTSARIIGWAPNPSLLRSPFMDPLWYTPHHPTPPHRYMAPLHSPLGLGHKAESGAKTNTLISCMRSTH